MNPLELYRAGRLGDAIQALGVELRNDPLDVQRRTFLFELLCFAGEYDRAEKQLDALAGRGKDADLGTLLYRSALHAERTRQEMFRSGTFPLTNSAVKPVAGTLNGEPFQTLQDGDPRLSARLEVFAAGQYTWIPLEHIEAVTMEPPKRLRDLLWAPARVRTSPSFRGVELGEVLLPVLTPLAWQNSDDTVRLGRSTDWQEIDGGREAPVGQKILLVDEEEFPILEVRELLIHSEPT